MAEDTPTSCSTNKAVTSMLDQKNGSERNYTQRILKSPQNSQQTDNITGQSSSLLSDTGLNSKQYTRKSPKRSKNIFQGFHNRQAQDQEDQGPSQQSTNTQNPTRKVILIGNSCVGKTSIISRLVENSFNLYQTRTCVIDQTEHTQMLLDGDQLKMQIWDTVGQEVFHSLNRFFYRSCSACVFVFDLSDLSSLQNLEYWFNEFTMHCSAVSDSTNQFPSYHDYQNSNSAQQDHGQLSRISFMVLANKIDLAEETMEQPQIQEILDQLKTWVTEKSKFNNINIISRVVSAKTGDNVHSSFCDLAQDIHYKQTRDSQRGKLLNDTLKNSYTTSSFMNNMDEDQFRQQTCVMNRSNVELHRDPQLKKSLSQNNDDDREDQEFLEVSPHQQRRSPSLIQQGKKQRNHPERTETISLGINSSNNIQNIHNQTTSIKKKKCC